MSEVCPTGQLTMGFDDYLKLFVCSCDDEGKGLLDTAAVAVIQSGDRLTGGSRPRARVFTAAGKSLLVEILGAQETCPRTQAALDQLISTQDPAMRVAFSRGEISKIAPVRSYLVVQFPGDDQPWHTDHGKDQRTCFTRDHIQVVRELLDWLRACDPARTVRFKFVRAGERVFLNGRCFHAVANPGVAGGAKSCLRPFLSYGIHYTIKDHPAFDVVAYTVLAVPPPRQAGRSLRVREEPAAVSAEGKIFCEFEMPAHLANAADGLLIPIGPVDSFVSRNAQAIVQHVELHVGRWLSSVSRSSASHPTQGAVVPQSLPPSPPPVDFADSPFVSLEVTSLSAGQTNGASPPPSPSRGTRLPRLPLRVVRVAVQWRCTALLLAGVSVAVAGRVALRFYGGGGRKRPRLSDCGPRCGGLPKRDESVAPRDDIDKLLAKLWQIRRGEVPCDLPAILVLALCQPGDPALCQPGADAPPVFSPSYDTNTIPYLQQQFSRVGLLDGPWATGTGPTLQKSLRSVAPTAPVPGQGRIRHPRLANMFPSGSYRQNGSYWQKVSADDRIGARYQAVLVDDHVGANACAHRDVRGRAARNDLEKKNRGGCTQQLLRFHRRALCAGSTHLPRGSLSCLGRGGVARRWR